MFGKYFKQNNYLKSNSITDIDFTLSEKAKTVVNLLLETQNHNKRQILGEKLVKTLSNDAEISQVKLKISETKQYSKRKNGKIVFKLYGYYKPKTKYIYIQNLTSIRGNPVAAKTFLNTLLHEWLHHYDTERLELHSIHTKGFYLRFSSLKNALGL